MIVKYFYKYQIHLLISQNRNGTEELQEQLKDGHKNAFSSNMIHIKEDSFITLDLVVKTSLFLLRKFRGSL